MTIIDHHKRLIDYLNTQEKIKLSDDIVKFCDNAQLPIQWSGCGQFWADSDNENLKFMLSHLHESEELFIRIGKRKKRYFSRRSESGDIVTVSKR